MSVLPGATGPLALVGGDEWKPGCEFDAELLARSGRSEVLVLPTAAAYEHPDRVVEAARAWFALFGATVRALMVLSHADACLEENAAAVREAGFVYLADGSPLHLRSVLKGSAVFAALAEAWRGGAVLAGSSAGATVLCDPMVDPRGGAYTVGLGLVGQLAIVPRQRGAAVAWRTLELAPPGVPVVAIDERTALIREPGGPWAIRGEGGVTVYLDGQVGSLEDLSAR